MIHHVATLGMVGYAILSFAQDLKKPGTVPEFLGVYPARAQTMLPGGLSQIAQPLALVGSRGR